MQLDLYLGLAALASKLHPALHPVASTRVQGWGGRALWVDCPPTWLKPIGGVLYRLEAERTEGNQYWSAISESM